MAETSYKKKNTGMSRCLENSLPKSQPASSKNGVPTLKKLIWSLTHSFKVVYKLPSSYVADS